MIQIKFEIPHAKVFDFWCRKWPGQCPWRKLILALRNRHTKKRVSCVSITQSPGLLSKNTLETPFINARAVQHLNVKIWVCSYVALGNLGSELQLENPSHKASVITLPSSNAS